MWKPVRLQGVGAASSIIDANPHPAGKLDPWRRQVVCLFGLALNGTPITHCESRTQPRPGQTCVFGTCSSPSTACLSKATVGWDATLNGNLAEQLIEPTMMGAYEGAGITVLAKGVKFPSGSDPLRLRRLPRLARCCSPQATAWTLRSQNPYPSNFLCNPSSIDGLTVKNSSQGGGGILVHAWGHNLQIANNRVYNNQGTLSGGITIGQGEHPDAYLVGSSRQYRPGSCVTPRLLHANEPGPAVLQQHGCQCPPQLRHPELVPGRRIVLVNPGRSRWRHLLQRQRLLQVQLQLGLRQHEHR